VVALHDSVATARHAIDASGSVIYTRNVISQDRRFKKIDEQDTLTVWGRTGP